MKSKPARYGIKVWVLADASTCYVWNFQIYTGKELKKGKRGGLLAEKNQGKCVVLDLVEGLGAGRGVTTDNYFTSLELAKELLKKNLTIVGTIRKNQIEVPHQLLPSKTCLVYLSIFVENDDAMLVSYVPKKNKCVILLSTEHNEPTCSSQESKKPDVILHYNSTKGGVDSIDWMIQHYTCQRSTRHWPVAAFMNFLDIAAINAYVLFCESNGDWLT